MKITTEIQGNLKLLHSLNEKVICSTLTEKKNTISRQNWTRLHWRALASFSFSTAVDISAEKGFAHLLSFVPTENY